MAPKTDHQRIEDLERALSLVVSAITDVYSAVARLGLLLVRESSLHPQAYRAISQELEKVGERLRSAIDLLQEAKDGQ